jgi:hypothetical protein
MGSPMQEIRRPLICQRVGEGSPDRRNTSNGQRGATRVVPNLGSYFGTWSVVVGRAMPSATITQVRRRVRCYNAAIVLGVSLFLAAVAALALFTTLSFEPTSLGRHPSPDAAQTGRH